MKICFYSF